MTQMHSPAEIAQELRQLAASLEQGNIEMEGKIVKLPEHLKMKVELEEEHMGEEVQFEIEVELVWPVRMQQD